MLSAMDLGPKNLKQKQVKGKMLAKAWCFTMGEASGKSCDCTGGDGQNLSCHTHMSNPWTGNRTNYTTSAT